MPSPCFLFVVNRSKSCDKLCSYSGRWVVSDSNSIAFSESDGWVWVDDPRRGFRLPTLVSDLLGGINEPTTQSSTISPVMQDENP